MSKILKISRITLQGNEDWKTYFSDERGQSLMQVSLGPHLVWSSLMYINHFSGANDGFSDVSGLHLIHESADWCFWQVVASHWPLLADKLGFGYSIMQVQKMRRKRRKTDFLFFSRPKKVKVTIIY